MVLSHLVCVAPNVHPLPVWADQYYDKLVRGAMSKIMNHPPGGDPVPSLQGVEFQIATTSHLKEYANGDKLEDDLILSDIKAGLHWEHVSRVMSVLRLEFGLGAVQNSWRRLNVTSEATVLASRNQDQFRRGRNQDQFGRQSVAGELPSVIDAGVDDLSLVSSPPAGRTATRPAPAAPAQPARAPVSQDVVNEFFFGSLWNHRTCNIIGAKGSDLIKAAEQGVGGIAPIPRSKVNPLRNMCLNFHIRQRCTNTCPFKYDHVAYTEEEFEPLTTWFDAGNFRPLTPEELASLGITRRSRGGGGRGRGRGRG